MKTTTKMIIEWAKRTKRNKGWNRKAVAAGMRKMDHQTRRDCYITATNLIECPR